MTNRFTNLDPNLQRLQLVYFLPQTQDKCVLFVPESSSYLKCKITVPLERMKNLRYSVQSDTDQTIDIISSKNNIPSSSTQATFIRIFFHHSRTLEAGDLSFTLDYNRLRSLTALSAGLQQLSGITLCLLPARSCPHYKSSRARLHPHLLSCTYWFPPDDSAAWPRHHKTIRPQ